MLKVGDIIEFTPKRGCLAGILIRATVVNVMKVYDPFTFQPVDKVIISFVINDHREEMALSDDIEYEIVGSEG